MARLGLPALLGLLSLGAALFFLDVRLAASNSHAEASVASAHFGAGEAGGVPPPARLVVAVEGDDDLAGTVRRELPARLAALPLLGGVEVLAPSETAAAPFLVVAIGQRDQLWTPVYARARLSARFAYASDTSEISPRDDGPFALGADGGGPVLRARGELTLTDATRGLISRPAYTRHLGQALAQETAARLHQALQNAQSR